MYEISNIAMRIDSWIYDVSVQEKTLQKYRSSTLDFRFSNTKFQKSIENVSPNQFFTLRLASVQGLVTSMTVIFRTISDDTIQTIKKLDMLDSSGASLLGGAALEHAYLQCTQRPRDNRYVNSSTEPDLATDLYFRVPISQESSAHGSQGSVNGYLPMSGTHQPSIYYESASSTTIPVEITVLYNSVSTLSIQNGITQSVQHS